MSLEKTSKFLSLVLRHQPEHIGLTLDGQGWADIAHLIAQANAAGVVLTEELLAELVATSDKQRFAIDPSGTRIRANQGHSINVDLKLGPQVPPAQLFHGTATRFAAAIRSEGLVAGARQHVHLSADRDTARKVGARHGTPLILTVDTAAMQRDGKVFYLSANQVWLTDAVDAVYIGFPD